MGFLGWKMEAPQIVLPPLEIPAIATRNRAWHYF